MPAAIATCGDRDMPAGYDRDMWLLRDQRRTRRWPHATMAAACALALTMLAGCGGSSSPGTSADPAGVVPAGAPIYIGAIVRPSGSLQTETLAAGRALTGKSDPFDRLVSVLQTPGAPALDYDRDVAPWLGPNAGMFITSLGSASSIEGLLGQGLGAAASGSSSAQTGAWPFGPGGAKGAIVLDTSDLKSAESFVAQEAAHVNAHSRSYRGVSYQASSDGDAFAVVKRFVVLGSEAAVQAVIDTAQGGAPLTSNTAYGRLVSVAPSDALGHVYASAAASLAGAAINASHPGLPSLLGTLAGTSALNASLVPAAGSLALDADVGVQAGRAAHTRSGLVRAAAKGGPAFRALPGNSWLAAGLGEGASAGSNLRALQGVLSYASTLGGQAAAEAAASPQVTLSVRGLIEGVLAPLKALTEGGPSATGWMGDAAIFASGTTVLELKAAITIDSSSAAAVRAAVASMATTLHGQGAEATPTTISGTEAAVEAKASGLPVTLAIAAGRGAGGQPKLVIGVSSTSVQDALHPASTMASSSALSSAQSALGAGVTPSMSVNVVSLAGLLEGIGLGEDPTIAPFASYLHGSTQLSGGGATPAAGIERLRLVLGLKPASG
jgi:Protein of unknown function (DUF3352)